MAVALRLQTRSQVLLFDAGFAVLDIGAAGNEGDFRLRGDDGAFTIHLDGGRRLFYVRDGNGRVTGSRVPSARSA